MSPRRRSFLALVSAVLLALLYPPFDAAPLAWVALLPLLLALDGATSRQALWLGWLCGTVGSLGVTGHWMYRAAYDYFALGWSGAAAFTLAVNQLFVATHFTLFGLGVSFLGRDRLRPLWIAAWLVTCEYVRAHAFGGNPWALLGQSQTSLSILQLCDLGGVYLVSFVLALTAAALAEWRRSRWPLVYAGLTVVGSFLYGEVRLYSLRRTDTAPMPVLLVQANLSNQERGRPEHYVEHLRRYVDLGRRAAARPVELVVWPENAVGFFPQDNAAMLQPVLTELRASGAALLFGAPRAADAHDGRVLLHNSAFLLTADGAMSYYDKRRLLPFVEQGLPPEAGPYVPGRDATVLSLGQRRFGVLICYEALYPELARQLSRNGAGFLVNLSNDSWFEAGAGPQQHYAFARLRAIENRLSLVRVTNSGVSGVIDASGAELVRLPVRVPIAQRIEVPSTSAWSFYREYGDVFAWTCIALAALGITRGRRRR